VRSPRDAVARSPPAIRRSNDRSVLTAGTREEAGWRRQSRGGRSSPTRRGGAKAERRSGMVVVWRGGGTPVHLGGGDWVLGHGGHERVRGRSQVKEKLSVGGAHREGWEDGGNSLGSDVAVLLRRS
jgi:hypothetical protein